MDNVPLRKHPTFDLQRILSASVAVGTFYDQKDKGAARLAAERARKALADLPRTIKKSDLESALAMVFQAWGIQA